MPFSDEDCRAQESQECQHELKFVLPNARIHALIPWLRTHCRPHPQYAATQVSSIYYDDRDWRSLAEKLDSTFLKTKVRVRWYESGASRDSEERSFVEGKFKVGAQRRKVRVLTDVPARALRTLPLSSPTAQVLPQLLRAHGLTDAALFGPVLQITYTRLRFEHPLSAHSFCLDYNIHVPRVNDTRLTRTSLRYLATAVFEQKGPGDRLSPLLRWLPHFGLKKQAFSIQHLPSRRDRNDSLIPAR